ncbi:MAG: ankyrin repeat domain-containing protein [Synergistaceae bacterium]|nr:ankyrin repeat domain-containing protein [Synergistaceae bacterium]
MPEYDPLLTMSALNMAIVSLHRITSSGDRLILDREYDTIINNLRMGEINPDPQLTELYQEIVRVIHKGRLRDDIRESINKAGSEKKHKSLKEIITGNVLKSFSTNPVKWLKKLAMSSASEYFTQEKAEELAQNNQDGQLRLRHDELDEYNELQLTLLNSSWNLLSHYHLLDSYRLTQKALGEFSSVMNESDPQRRMRKMKYFESDFLMYSPYWFYLAKSASEVGNDDEAEKYFARFGEVWRPVLRRDPYRAEAMKFKIESLMRSGVTRENAGEILKCLEEMRANTELEDWANNIFAGMVYFSLGRKDEAEECVMCNIDLEFELEMSRDILKNMEMAVQETPPPPKLKFPPISDNDFVKLCESGDITKIEEAIVNGANVNAKEDKDEDGCTALMIAVCGGHADVVELLLKHGADVNARDNTDWTALIYATNEGHEEIAKILLKHGADVDAREKIGITPLINAASHCYAEIVELLLKHGANVNAQRDDGWTALIAAAFIGDGDTTEVLLRYGADVNIKDKDGLTALVYADYAAETDDTPEAAEVFRKYGAK